ncbi:MAG: WcbI family polysaccharide biosynthesis putative acetyltransferase [Pseudomonadota bacterium]
MSNCTHAPIREYLSATGLFDSVESEAIFTIPADQLHARYDRVVRDFDVIFATVLYGDKWGPWEHKTMRAALGDKVQMFDAPFFQGLHPDLVHISHKGDRFLSPIGDYHSGLIYWGWRRQIPIEQLSEMYHDGDLPDLFDAARAWETSLQTFHQREQLADIRVAPQLDQICRAQPAMLTFNHPTMPIMAAQCDALCRKLFGDRTTTPIDPTNIHNVLLSDVIIPVSPAAIRANDLPYRTSAAFKFGLASPHKNKGYLSFERFARLSYARYGCVEPKDLSVTTPAPLAKALTEEVAA